LPLGPGQALSIGITSYDGGVFYGVNGDRDAMPDIDVLAALIEESLAELVDASPVAAARSAAALGRVGRLKPASRRTAARVPRGSRS
ncbi:MAG: diacylglycerol O-acyltransferase / wax synthase, partial [Pseudonocardiales bacterium]|nr:diacylglycerol O-acyltransferase / wax synthase [Pseudonocardiales bacterium]